MEHNNINPINPSHGHDDPRVRDGRVLRHLPPARDRSVFDRNMAMMRALEAGEPVTRVAKRYGVVLLQCLFSRLISIFPQCGRMVFPGLVIMQSVM